MAQVSDLVQVGFPPNQANALGDTFQDVAGAGTTIADATSFTASTIYVTGGALNSGIKLPRIDASKTKEHVILNHSANSIRCYVGDAADSIKSFVSGAGVDYVDIASQASKTFRKVSATFWMAY